MHFSDLGAIAQTLALVFALYAIASSALGARLDRPALVASGRRALYVVAAFLVTACVSLILSFTTHDFGARYVYEHSSLSMPWQYTTTAFYSGQEGSLLYWATTLSLFAALAVALHGRSPARLMPWVAVVLGSILSFLLIALNFVSTPFARTSVVPLDGLGLNPLLRDPGMLVHPPMLLLGYMSFSVPFAFAIAALITGELDSGWLRSIRRWTLAAWTIQTTGLLLGAWWAYHVLGWGGYWGWDPVENAALLPWLTATAFLHSTMVQERRGSLKVWNLALIIATFALCIFGTFEVRSGIISSVHSFAYSAIGGVFLGFLAAVLLISIGLFVYRLPRLRPEHEFDSVVSREGSFLLNNLLLTGIAFATFWGTLFPLLSSSFRGQTMTVGADFYQQVNGPLFAILILVMGIGPLLAWRRASWPSVWRNFRWPALIAAIVAIALPILGVRDFWAVVGLRDLRLLRRHDSVRGLARRARAPCPRRELRAGGADALQPPPRPLRRLPRPHGPDYPGGGRHRRAFLPDAARGAAQARRESDRRGLHAYASTARSARLSRARTPSRRSSRCCAAARRCARSRQGSAPSPDSPTSPSASSRSPPLGWTMSTSSSPR